MESIKKSENSIDRRKTKELTIIFCKFPFSGYTNNEKRHHYEQTTIFFFRVIYMKTFSCLAYIALTHKHAQMYQVTIKANANIKSRKFTKLRSKKSTDFH